MKKLTRRSVEECIDYINYKLGESKEILFCYPFRGKETTLRKLLQDVLPDYRVETYGKVEEANNEWYVCIYKND